MISTCFHICPIGTDGSKIRKHSDQVSRHIIKPAFIDKDISIIRADQMPKSGMITTQIMNEIFNSDLVIADLTNANPNVYYELAIRHTCRKPYIQIINIDEPIPFDLAGVRTIKFNLTDPDSIASAVTSLKRQIEAIEHGHIPDSPVSMAISESLFTGNDNAISVFLEKFWQIEADFERLNQSIDSLVTEIPQIQDDVSEIQNDISSIESNVSSLQTDVSSIESNVSSLQTDVSSIEINVSDISN